MSIDHSSPSTPRCGWAVYYTDNHITVTSWYVETETGRYPITELDGVLRFLTFRHPGRIMALIAGGIEIGLAVPLAVAFRSVALALAGLVAAVGMAIGVLMDARANPRWMELRAGYRGDEVLLIGTRDRVAFEQVRRALIRAIEVNHLPWP